MANHTFLLTSDSPAFPAKPDSCEVLLGASYMIPVFWYMLFEHESISMAPAEIEGGGIEEYPRLTSASDNALLRAEARWGIVRPVIGPDYDELFKKWYTFISENVRSYVHCETFELCMLFEDAPTFTRHFRLCLSAFSDAGPVRESLAWKELFLQANALDDGEISPAGIFSFCGFSWSTPVPWE